MNTLDTQDEDQLARQAGKGCERSFELLFRRYYPEIHAYCWRICADSNYADDLAQKSFIKASRVLEQYQGGGKFKAWIYKIALNTARDYLRQRKRDHDKKEAYMSQKKTDTDMTRDQTPVAETLEQLPSNLQEVIILVHAQGFTHREAARILDRSPGTVSWQISEDRRLLKLERNSTQCRI